MFIETKYMSGYGCPRPHHCDFAEVYARYVHHCSGDKEYLFGKTKICIEDLLHRLQLDEGCEEGIWNLYPDFSTGAVVDGAYRALYAKRIARGFILCLDILQENDLLSDDTEYFDNLRDIASRDVI